MTKEEYNAVSTKIPQYNSLKNLLDWTDILINAISYGIEEVRGSRKESVKIEVTINGITDSAAEFNVEQASKLKELLDMYRSYVSKRQLEL